MTEQAIVLTGEKIEKARKIALRLGLGLEIKGMHRHGRSAYSIIKEQFGLKGNKQKVYDQFSDLLEKDGILFRGKR